MEKQFLPLCDLLFNLISLAAYFCDVVFDLTTGYAFLQKQEILWGSLILSFVLTGIVSGQIVSLVWCKKTPGTWILHLFGLGVIWRHFKLLLPLDIDWVKSEMRDVCVLRLVHGFVNSGPTLLVQLHLLMNHPMEEELKDLTGLSVCLSAFGLCWALASYSKNLKTRNVHRLVLTWPGVITQFTWRLGTVGTRAVCLVLYSSLYGPWVLVVVLLHWISMFLWLVSTEALSETKRAKTLTRTWTSALVAFVYVLAYINVKDGRHRNRMAVYYTVMTLENALLCFAWYLNAPHTKMNNSMPLFLAGAYASGILFMLLYYRYFHVRRLNYDTDGSVNASNENTTAESTTAPETDECPKIEVKQEQPVKQTSRLRYYGGTGHHHGIPGVFNCRFTNPYSAAVSKRKKKKPTSFVPPPSILPSQHCPVPFWCRPLVSEVKVDQRSPVNIRAKLEEKKRQQLAELKNIEEEIIRQRNATANYPQELTPAYLQPEVVPYTLPRQTRYNKRRLRHHPIFVRRYCPPANSSDGDVDSWDDAEEAAGCWYMAAQHRFRHQTRTRHETKL